MTYPDSEIFWLVLVTLALPFISFLSSFVFPQRYSWVVPITSSLLLLASSLTATTLFSMQWNHAPFVFHHPWFSAGQHSVDIGVHVDNLSVLMITTVSWVSFLVHVYSIGYMAGEVRVRIYYGLLGLFTFSMLGLVMADNLLVAFVFWELVGLSSYLLIGFWRERPSAAAAATKAFLMNRVGDVGLLLGLLLLWVEAGSLDLAGFETRLARISETMLSLIGLCILVGVMAKSAQFPLSSWLPDAMEGPTPVSALIHAATMVAAGIFLIGRVYVLFTPTVLLVMSIIGMITAATGAWQALHQFNIKRILAYSTISQLGWMLMCLGAGSPAATEMHLVAHAFFKAGLFLVFGATIHVLEQATLQNELEGNLQDIRQLGGLARKMPFEFITFVACASSLAGLPLFSGFLTKESMLDSIGNPVFRALGFLIVILTVLYTFRLGWFVFFSPPRTTRLLEPRQIPVVPIVMRLPVAALAVASAWFVVSFNPISFAGWMYSGLHPEIGLHSNVLSALSATVVVSSLVVSYFLFQSRKVPAESSSFQFMSNHFDLYRWYLKIIVKPVLFFSKTSQTIDSTWIDGVLHSTAQIPVGVAHVLKWFDRSIVDGLASTSVNVVGTSGRIIRSIVDGKIQSYILWTVTALIILIGWILLS